MSYIFLFFLISDQVLSITPKTEEQVEILKNVSTQYEVETFFSFSVTASSPPILTSNYI